ncbi:MAG: pyridoxal-phosphate dependent enzyme, partial [Vicingaceae bacterium]
YDNPSNAKGHYLSTGPEIWEQTEGKITHFVVGVGTGGTISGVGKYLKERNPNIKLWGIDTYGSVFKKYHETGIFDQNEIYPYITEGIGEDILPENVNFDIIDKFEKVTDKDAAVWQRKIAKEEGICVGNSAGSAVKGLLQLKDELSEEDVVVVVFHDHGSRYVGKMFNDDWMRERGFLDEEKTNGLDLIKDHAGKHLVTVSQDDPVSQAILLMNQYGVSQIPVAGNKEFVGSLTDNRLFAALLENPELKELPVKTIMESAFPVVLGDTSIEDISKQFQSGAKAVMVNYDGDKHHIITQQDMIKAIA